LISKNPGYIKAGFLLIGSLLFGGAIQPLLIIQLVKRDDLIGIYAQLPHTIANDLNHSVFTNCPISNGRSVIKVTDIHND